MWNYVREKANHKSFLCKPRSGYIKALSNTHTHTHARARAHTHTHTHIHTHKHTYTHKQTKTLLLVQDENLMARSVTLFAVAMQSESAILCSQWSGTWREPYSHSDVIALLQGYGTYVSKLQALVYDILPSTTAIFSYAIGSRKQSANEQFSVGAQTTQIISNVCFITNHAAYSSSNKTKIVWIETELFFFFLPGVDAPHVCVRAWALGCFYLVKLFGGCWPRR